MIEEKGGKEAKGGCPRYYKGEGRVVSEAFWFLGKTPREKLGDKQKPLHFTPLSLAVS